MGPFRGMLQDHGGRGAAAQDKGGCAEGRVAEGALTLNDDYVGLLGFICFENSSLQFATAELRRDGV